MYSVDSSATLISKCCNGLTNGTVVSLCTLLHLYLKVVMDKLMVQ